MSPKDVSYILIAFQNSVCTIKKRQVDLTIRIEN